MKSYIAVSDRAPEFIMRAFEREEIEKFLPAIRLHSGKRDMTADDVHVRGMWLCNSQPDHYNSRFTLSALDEIAELLPGRPVMRGHRYDQLPVGRFFAASREHRGFTSMNGDRVPKNDNYWVKGMFYVPKDPEGDAIVRRIDTGIYREVSLGWRCLGADCDLCGNPINDRNQCPHVPGEVYDSGLCIYRFSAVTSVLEGSLVFAGGQKDTSTFTPGETSARLISKGVQMSLDEFIEPFDLPSTWMGPLKREFVRQLPEMMETTRQRRHEVQSILCSRERFEDRSAAARWVRDHEFRADQPDEVGDVFRFRQFELDKDSQTSMLDLDQHVKAVMAKRSQRRTREVESDDPSNIEELFAATT